ASSSDGPSPWRLLEGAAGAVVVLAGGAFALRRRRAAVAAAKSQEGVTSQEAAKSPELDGS
ncbi:D-alanyl-D-alanine carboxypeptidase, partial [Streptomyces prunicolor]|nr:D-alanyl-D-alanine carboxypeptidase [Streptomyces prunicolor]